MADSDPLAPPLEKLTLSHVETGEEFGGIYLRYWAPLYGWLAASFSSVLLPVLFGLMVLPPEAAGIASVVFLSGSGYLLRDASEQGRQQLTVTADALILSRDFMDWRHRGRRDLPLDTIDNIKVRLGYAEWWSQTRSWSLKLFLSDGTTLILANLETEKNARAISGWLRAAVIAHAMKNVPGAG